MAIFTKTTKEAKVTKVTKAKKEGALALGSRVNAIVRPHITEKAAILAEKGTYVFEVAKDTNKIEIAKAIEALYNVKPTRVNIVNLPDTRVFVRNRKGVKSGIRKALVTLKKGDKIEIL
ncbi:MAG: 50S ribosomal protein L23 [Parcubacteria group bacterium GW2011_GWA1_44_13]|uniref:Large ribosomal subunit protein uL23 n=1 Tax=Candidatus Nomurabacteria bacterium GW2011_GWB1_44_12 TaxID=1618748 RepID=A0A837IBU3_9BACT|nr:MAG: 50S ribosomal protein L23 [Candidatus Nomurabacteria bacterium GW2011_GWB1_44_12]KKT37870.1 MAG: 50S ribosomal protein L23 [Parcubacteria group bacterium GW2011_GWA1_44_13]HBB44080.1 50S ribosomal protein L23 [Candidatus Yonathbacteria bacterium]